jgi:hypothetical protein
MTVKDDFEEGPELPPDKSLPEKWRTPEACFRTGLRAVIDADVKTWSRCHHDSVAKIINICVELQRSRLELPKSEPPENVMKKTFKDLAGDDGKDIAPATAGKTRYSKDGTAARLRVDYDFPDGKYIYRFLKTDDGWKIEGPLLVPPSKQ